MADRGCLPSSTNRACRLAWRARYRCGPHPLQVPLRPRPSSICRRCPALTVCRAEPAPCGVGREPGSLWCRGRAGVPAPADAASRNAVHRNSPRKLRRPLGPDAPAVPPACRRPASGRRDRGGGPASLPVSCRNGYHGRRMDDSTQRENWWKRLSGGLKRTSSSLGGAVTGLVAKRKLDAETLEELENELIRADLGLDFAARIAEALGEGRFEKEITTDDVKAVLAGEIEKVLLPVARPLEVTARLLVILVAGVTGPGKTTTIGKLAARFRAEDKNVMLVAGDTFRAAAIDQLKIWGARTNASVMAGEPGSDAASLAFDAVTDARTRGVDVVLIDTAGRLQNRAELMNELEKMVRVIRKVEVTAPHAVLLVLDATVGQNALSQVEIFGKIAGVTGLVMTKLDGTAKGGILVAIADKFGLPVHFIGVGEAVEDLLPFTAHDFARAVVGLES